VAARVEWEEKIKRGRKESESEKVRKVGGKAK
jgi:hypothetical protein